MLERQIEMATTQAAKQGGGKAFKWVSPGNPGVPDRIVLLPVAPEHRAIVARYLRFVECKAPGKKPTALQAKVHDQLRVLGYDVRVIDNLGDSHAIAE